MLNYEKTKVKNWVEWEVLIQFTSLIRTSIFSHLPWRLDDYLIAQKRILGRYLFLSVHFNPKFYFKKEQTVGEVKLIKFGPGRLGVSA
jgi:hypothetical protein